MEHIFSANVLRHQVLLDESGSSDSVDALSGFCSKASPEAGTNTYQEISVPSDTVSLTDDSIETAQKWHVLTSKRGILHKYPLQAALPKVQMQRDVSHRKLPRDVEVDRRRRSYCKVDMLQLLAEAGITNDELMPTEDQYYALSENSFTHFLPLSFFDDTDFDTHSPEAWLQLGVVEDETYPVPARAFLPVNKSLFKYSWRYVSVFKYNPETFYWTAASIDDDTIYELPQMQINFLAEDPLRFVERVKKAVKERDIAEKRIMMESIVDCVLLQDMNEEAFANNERLEALTAKLPDGNPKIIDLVRKEAYLVYEHLMALYEFDKFIMLMPKEFPAYGDKLILNSLPRFYKLPANIMEAKSVKALKLDITAMRYCLLDSAIFYTAAGIEATGRVAIECQNIETMSMFHCHFMNPVALEDFLEVQDSHSTLTAAFLKNKWPGKIASGISLVLRANGKGSLDIALDYYPVYQMIKTERFMEMTRFRMQESMQSLLEKSIYTFSTLLTNPCLQFLPLKPNFKWTNNFIDTHFPYHAPIFSMIISVSEQRKVVYSTDPRDFQPLLMHVFKQALEKTTGVRRVDPEVTIHLKYPPDLYIETVELIEEMYAKWNELIKDCYHQACFPLLAYARRYERFIDFYLLKVSDFMHDYESRKHTSVEVKHDILEHKRQKEELRLILPAFIVIGPFHINVDLMKQSMIKKHIEIVKRLLEYYVQRMYDINEALHERCLEVYQRITDRPQSIEHLHAISEFALTVPDVVASLRSDIQIMWLEYDILDLFHYNLTDSQFVMKWEVFGWPHKILKRLSNLREEQKLDIDDFKRIHMIETGSFQDMLESLNEEVQAFSLVFDPTRAIETAVDVKKTWRQIQEAEKQGSILGYRQTLFDLEPLSMEFLESIIVGFSPYRNLWLTCVDFLKLEEAATGNPLNNIDLEAVWASMEEIRASLKEALDVFAEKPEVQNVAVYFLAKLDEFVPIWQCMKWVKNEHWLYLHWQELSNRAGIEIKYTLAMNFAYLQRKGIMAQLDLVKEISEKAESEADEIRRKMEEEERRKRAEEEAVILRKASRKCRRDILWDPEPEASN